ncbi:MAG: hypothetical protein IJX50_00205 [Clostridia bacterium]|nr:hypothetical protein [Clostridia bacterium]
MARYIDIEGAGIGKANREQFLVPEFADGWNAVLKILEKEPTADVVEVVHGYWIEDIKEIVPLNGIVPIKALVGYRCSVCNRAEFNKEPYCNCGAKMDGKGDT